MQNSGEWTATENMAAVSHLAGNALLGAIPWVTAFGMENLTPED